MSFDVSQLRRDFPILDREVHGKPLVYLDNAASADLIETAVGNVLEQGLRTADIYSAGTEKVGTAAMGDAVVAELKALRAANA